MPQYLSPDAPDFGYLLHGPELRELTEGNWYKCSMCCCFTRRDGALLVEHRTPEAVWLVCPSCKAQRASHAKRWCPLPQDFVKPAKPPRGRRRPA